MRWRTKQKQKESTETTTLVKDPPPTVNGEPEPHASEAHAPASVNLTATDHGNAAQDVVQIMEEFNRYIEDGSKEMFGNVTNALEEKIGKLPEDAAKEMTTYLYDMTAASTTNTNARSGTSAFRD